MRWVLILMVVISTAQAKTITFKVNNPKPHVQVTFKDTVIWRGEDNIVKAEISGKYKIKRLVVKGGEVRVPGSHFKIRVHKGHEANLLVFVEAPNGKVKLAYQRLLQVKTRAIPVALMCGVKTDSVLTKTKLLNLAQMKGRLNSGRWAKIKSFDMWYSDGEEIKALKSTNDCLTIKMKNAIRKHVKHGSAIEFRNIKWVSDQGYEKKLVDMRVFINDEKTKASVIKF